MAGPPWPTTATWSHTASSAGAGEGWKGSVQPCSTYSHQEIQSEAPWLLPNSSWIGRVLFFLPLSPLLAMSGAD